MFTFKRLYLKRIVISVSIIAVNTVILFTCLEFFTGIVFFMGHKIKKSSVFSQPVIKSALDEEYAPWVEFKTIDYKSDQVNVKGFVRKSHPDAVGNVKAGENNIHDIYFFGGSTMFGANVLDSQTIPSHFAALFKDKNKGIALRAWNYGQPYYYSRQELFLLFSLISKGRHPKTVVFLDGLNDVLIPGSSYYSQPFFTPSLKEIFLSGRPKTAYLLSALFQKTHIYRALRKIKFIGNKKTDIADFSYLPPKGVSEDDCARIIAQNYLDMIKTTKMLCRAFNIKCYFFWQPVPYYNYDRSQDAVCDKRSFSLFLKVFPIIKDKIGHTPDLYYMGDLLLEYRGSPFVDSFHYSSDFNRFIASEMLKIISFSDDISAN